MKVSWILFLGVFTAAAGDPREEAKSSKITFKIKNEALLSDIKFDPNNLDKSVLTASVGTAIN